MNSALHFSSADQTWTTPKIFFEKCQRRFGPFDLDAAAVPETALAPSYCSPPSGSCYSVLWPGNCLGDGLAVDWVGNVWLNPPYGRKIGVWVRRAFEMGQRGARVVCLVPARTDTAWWHDWVSRADCVEFVRGRLKFGGANNPAPFPSALVVFGSVKEGGGK